MTFKMTIVRNLLLSLCVFGIVANNAIAQTHDAEERILFSLFDEQPISESMFHESFLAQVPLSRMEQVIKQYQGTLGELRQVVRTENGYDMLFSKGKAPSKVTLDGNGQIVGLWFGMWTLLNDSIDTLNKELLKLEGQVSITVTENNKRELISLNGDMPLAVGSAFKLYILLALEKEVESGDISWDQVITLRPDWFSLPTGFTQTWPVGSPVTIRSLSNLMISVSDNTATDHLLYTIGRKKVEDLTPSRARPFLSTMDMFRLKWGPDPSIRERYIKSDEASRREILSKIRNIKAENITPRQHPIAIDTIEWHLTTKELCQVIWKLRDNPSISINPGLAGKNDWFRVGFKGGSEPGVLNYTHVIQESPESPIYCVAATINHLEKNVDSPKFTELISRLINVLKK